MNRFSVIVISEGAFGVSDDQCKTNNMPQRAVSILFATFDDAKEVAALLNRSWAKFVRNPT